MSIQYNPRVPFCVMFLIFIPEDALILIFTNKLVLLHIILISVQRNVSSILIKVFGDVDTRWAPPHHHHDVTTRLPQGHGYGCRPRLLCCRPCCYWLLSSLISATAYDFCIASCLRVRDLQTSFAFRVSVFKHG